MKLVSWNVNGIRAALKKGFCAFADAADADVLCLQETRATPEQVELDMPGYEAFWNPAKRKGYAGTAVFSKREPLSHTLGLRRVGLDDDEGRVITLEFEDYFLVNVYTPNSGERLDRLEYRTTVWDPTFLSYLRELETQKPVILCGDLNVAHQPIDLAEPDANEGSAGFTPEERRGFDRIVAAGFIDTFRQFNAQPGQYTYWSFMRRSRQRNIGWRIDYFCISPALKPRLVSSEILPDVLGSDHCPIVMTLE